MKGIETNWKDDVIMLLVGVIVITTVMALGLISLIIMWALVG